MFTFLSFWSIKSRKWKKNGPKLNTRSLTINYQSKTISFTIFGNNSPVFKRIASVFVQECTNSVYFLPLVSRSILCTCSRSKLMACLFNVLQRTNRKNMRYQKKHQRIHRGKPFSPHYNLLHKFHWWDLCEWIVVFL